MPCRHYTPLSVCLSRFHSYSNDIGRFFFYRILKAHRKAECTLYFILTFGGIATHCEAHFIGEMVQLHARTAQRNTQHVIKSMFQFIVAYTI